MKKWAGSVYPKGAKPKDFLKYYTQRFNTIELNSTHYGIPNEMTIQKWYGQAADDFKFCPKVLQRISHGSNLPIDLIGTFCEAISGFKEKLGTCFIQLPPYFGIDRLPVLKHFLKKWATVVFPLAVVGAA